MSVTVRQYNVNGLQCKHGRQYGVDMGKCTYAECPLCGAKECTRTFTSLLCTACRFEGGLRIEGGRVWREAPRRRIP